MSSNGVADRDEAGRTGAAAAVGGGAGARAGGPAGDSPRERPAGLDLEVGRAAAPPGDAATVLILRDRGRGPEVFCVQRHQGMAFMGGAVVFPGGKVDPADRGAVPAASEADPRGLRLVEGDLAALRAVVVAACREALEEAAIVPAVRGAAPVSDDEAVRLRAALEAGTPLAAALAASGASLDLAALVPFARWVTPEAERRRYDARFFLLALPGEQVGRHDGKETTLGFWDTPAGVLARFAAGEVQLAPPTTRCLELLVPARSTADALAIAAAQSLLPVCPHFVGGDPPVLALPGDPEHPVAEVRVPGATRFVLRDGRFVSEAAPA